MSDWNEITITLRYRPAVLEKGEGYSRDEPRTELELVQEIERSMNASHFGGRVELEIVEKPDAEVEKVLVLSTAHVPERVLKAEELNLRHHRWENHEYGFTVFLLSALDEDEESNWDETEVEWFKDILVTARKHGCTYVNFDRDGASIESLPDYCNGNELTVRCKLCGDWVHARTAHLHQNEWVGADCCWDDRLKTTE